MASAEATMRNAREADRVLRELESRLRCECCGAPRPRSACEYCGDGRDQRRTFRKVCGMFADGIGHVRT